jgi:hypothetical protein
MERSDSILLHACLHLQSQMAWNEGQSNFGPNGILEAISVPEFPAKDGRRGLGFDHFFL